MKLYKVTHNNLNYLDIKIYISDTSTKVQDLGELIEIISVEETSIKDITVDNNNNTDILKILEIDGTLPYTDENNNFNCTAVDLNSKNNVNKLLKSKVLQFLRGQKLNEVLK